MTSSVNTELLSYIVFKEKRLRLAWLQAPDTLYIDRSGLKERLQVLFVAADILALSNIPSKNHCRIHARFAKEGLAVKICFAGTSLSRCPAGMWFYTIKGLFKVAFEYLTEDFQEFCLIYLKDWWISALSEPTVSDEVTISHLKYAYNGITEPSEIDDFHKTSTGGSTADSSQLGLMKNISSSIEQPCEGPECADRDIIYVNDDFHLCALSAEAKQQPLTKHKNLLDKLRSLVDELLNQVNCLNSSHCEATDSSEYYLCDSLITLLTFYRNEILHSSDPCIFPLEILKQFLSLGVKRNISNMDANDFGIGIRRNAMLCLICAWLGDQFAELSHTVEKKVTAFKKKHIGSIDNLPPAVSIISDIFPQCMSVLLVHWMMNKATYGQQKGSHLNEKTTLEAYEEVPIKKLRTNDHLDHMGHLAPLVQIILEFANRSLISGVAHVIYAQVIQSVK